MKLTTSFYLLCTDGILCEACRTCGLYLCIFIACSSALYLINCQKARVAGFLLRGSVFDFRTVLWGVYCACSSPRSFFLLSFLPTCYSTNTSHSCKHFQHWYQKHLSCCSTLRLALCYNSSSGTQTVRTLYMNDRCLRLYAFIMISAIRPSVRHCTCH